MLHAPAFEDNNFVTSRSVAGKDRFVTLASRYEVSAFKAQLIFREFPMWIVRLALRRPHTFIVLAILLFLIGPLAILRTPTDIFPNINIPVVSIVWSYNGFSAEDMAHRITSNYERALTSDVEDIEHIESQSLNGVSVIKIFFHPGADINRAIAEAGSNSESILRVLPPGTLPPKGSGTAAPCTVASCVRMKLLPRS